MKKAFLIILVFTVAGCATDIRYFSFTSRRYPQKPIDYPIAIYRSSTHPALLRPYVVLGKIKIQRAQGEHATPDRLIEEAKAIARMKGADAIIDADVTTVPESGAYTVPFYDTVRDLVNEDVAVKFTGQFVVFTAAPRVAEEER